MNSVLESLSEKSSSLLVSCSSALAPSTGNLCVDVLLLESLCNCIVVCGVGKECRGKGVLLLRVREHCVEALALKSLCSDMLESGVAKDCRGRGSCASIA